MADLAASAVTISKSYPGFGGNGRRYAFREAVFTLTAQGTAANKIPASVLKLDTIIGCFPLVQDDDTDVVVGSPDYAGNNLLLKAAGSNAPADYTGTFKGIVFGISETE